MPVEIIEHEFTNGDVPSIQRFEFVHVHHDITTSGPVFLKARQA